MDFRFPDKENFQGLPIEINNNLIIVRETPLLKVMLPDPYKTPEGFILFGINDPIEISKLRSIEGVSIEELEGRMIQNSRYLSLEDRRRRIKKHISGSWSTDTGYISDDDSLTEILARDTQTVLDNNQTHTKLADFLFYAINLNAYLGYIYEQIINMGLSDEELEGKK